MKLARFQFKITLMLVKEIKIFINVFYLNYNTDKKYEAKKFLNLMMNE